MKGHKRAYFHEGQTSNMLIRSNTMNILRLFVTELVVFHICLCENMIFHNDEPPKAGFGEFIISLQSITDCNSTEKTDPIIFGNFKIGAISDNSTDNTLYITSNTKEKQVLTKIYIATELWKYGKYSKLVDQSSDNICTHPIGKKMIKFVDKIVDKSECTIKTGNFTSPMFRLNEVAHSIVGNKFFYGLVKGILKIYTEKGLGFCIVVIYMSKPKTQKKKIK